MTAVGIHPSPTGDAMTRRLVLSLLCAVVGLASTSAVALADHRRDGYERIQHQAAELADHSRDLYYEIRQHYRGEPFAAGVMSEVLGLYRSARRLNGYAAARSSYSALEREMSRMESAFHQVEDAIRGISAHHGSHRHVRELVRHIDDLVHDVHEDVHALGDRDFFGPDRGRPSGEGTRPIGGVGLSPGDWYFGGGGFTVRLGR